MPVKTGCFYGRMQKEAAKTMDELLHMPHQEREAQGALKDWRSRLRAMAEGAASRWQEGSRRAGELLTALRERLGEHPVGPVPYLAASMVAGAALLLTTVYTPGYVVTIDGAQMGAVADTALVETAVEAVENRAARILDQDYAYAGEIECAPALVEKTNLTTRGELETYLFNQIGEVMKSYVLTVDGQVIGAADEEETIQALLDQVAAPYLNENTVDYGFVEDVRIRWEYISSDTVQDTDAMLATLTSNQQEATIYTVVEGDTYWDIAMDRGMSLSELESMNPGLDMNSLLVGQELVVEQSVPMLSVYTVDNLTYEQAIECPVEYVDDSSMYIGDTRTVSTGTEGVAQVNADVTYVNGVETEREVLSTVTVTEPTATVIAQGTTERPRTASTGTYIWPVNGTVTSTYGCRYIFGSYSFHSGLDIAAPYGTSIKAADGGKVTYAGWMSGYGYLIIITHDNGTQTYYAHCSSLVASVGDRVYQGQLIARVGSTGRSTGNHCHFEVRVNGSTKNPYNYL